PGGPPPAPPPPGERPPCGIMFTFGRLSAGGMTMAQFSQLLGQRVNRTVIDRTALMGAFDLDLEFAPDQQPPAGALPAGVQPPATDAPSIYTALQEQLGLKLDSQKGAI